MGTLGGVISNLLSLGSKLLPAVSAFTQDVSSSSSPAVDQNVQIEAELQKLMRLLERIRATLYDAEQREVRDLSVNLWLKELKGVAYDAEDVLDEYHYELSRAQVETRSDASPPDSRKRKLIQREIKDLSVKLLRVQVEASDDSPKKKLIQVPNGILDQILQIQSRFDEIVNGRIALQLSEDDGPRRCNNELQIALTSHFVIESNIFGREKEKEKLIDLLSSKGDGVSVVTIVGMGGIGKTTLAQLAYNDQRIRERFDKFGWICVSEDFNVQRLTKESIESITRKECSLTNFSALQEKIQEEISGKMVLLILDDVWNEKKSLWDLFLPPFMSAAFVKVLVTTRNDLVARIIQTEPTFNLGYLSAKQCWRLFEHYAFGIQQNKDPKLVKIGKQIMNKCGLLPMVVKSIASLLRHEPEEENWRDILENELWESDVSNEIFPSLQISYARLPTYLKPCFLYCAMFPKDYSYDVGDLVKLWINQGFIESKGNKNAEKIGFEYAQQLCQRSLFEGAFKIEGNYLDFPKFKLHDIVHDLARLNSENGCYSIEVSKVPVFPNVLYHLYVAPSVDLIDLIPSNKLITLRTLIIGDSVKNFFSTFNLSMAPKLKALQIFRSRDYELESLFSVGNVKHLRYLLLGHMISKTLPESLCSLYSLQSLTLRKTSLKELPTKIGNLINLEELIIEDCINLVVLPESLCQLMNLKKLFLASCDNLKELPNNIENLVSLEELCTIFCYSLRMLPRSICQLKALRKFCVIKSTLFQELPSDMGSLTNLRTLKIYATGASYLPPSLNKLVEIETLDVALRCKQIGWLGCFPNLRGTLYLKGLENITNSWDVKHANLVSMRNLEHLIISWNEVHNEDTTREKKGSVLDLTISISHLNQFCQDPSPSHFWMVHYFKPHPNLSKLDIRGYSDHRFPEWIGSLCKLNYLNITSCTKTRFLEAECLPLELKELEIYKCHQLVFMPGIHKLKSLVKLSIDDCENLCSLMESSHELKMVAGVGSNGSSLLGLKNLPSLRSLKITRCLKLKAFADESLPIDPRNVDVCRSPGLRVWCLQHGINYRGDE